MNLAHIFTDHRGSIHAITEGLYKYPEVAILQTKAGLARGGCIHDKSQEFLTVIEGQIIYIYGAPLDNSNATDFLVNKDGNIEVLMNVGESICIKPNTPHYFISLTDSTVCEWGADPSEKQAKHEAFRALANAHNKGK